MYSELLAYLKPLRASEKFKKFVALSACGALLEGRVWYRLSRHKRLYPNLFVLLMARGGTGKTMMSNISEHIIEHINTKFKEIPENQVLIGPQKVTPAGLIKMMSEGKKNIVTASGATCTYSPFYAHSAEFGVLADDIGGGNFLTDLLELYDCHPLFRKLTKGNGFEIVTQPILSLLADTTPAWWHKNMPQNSAESGFTSRLLIAYEPNVLGRDPRPRYGSEEQFEEVLFAAERLIGLWGEVKESAEAAKWADTFFHVETETLRMRENGEGILGTYYNRRMDQLRKLGMIFATTRGSYVIETSDYILAREHLLMVEQTLPLMSIMVDGKHYTKLMGAILEKIPANPERIKLPELLRKLMRTVAMAESSEVLAKLEALLQAGLIEYDEEGYFVCGAK